MNDAPFVIERTYHAPAEKVWQAITDKKKLKKWYFDLSDFEPEVGFEFEFTAKDGANEWRHLCKVTEVVPGKKIAYSWRYDGYAGNSEVSFELFAEGDATKIVLTHTGLESFPQDKASFKKESFAKGWTQIVGTNLKNYVEKM